MLDCVLDNVLNSSVVDWRSVCDAVDRTPSFNGVEEGGDLLRAHDEESEVY